MRLISALAFVLVLTLAAATTGAWCGESPKVTRGPTGVLSSDPALAANVALIDSLHQIAQPAAISDWNRKIAGTIGHFKRPHPRLRQEDLKRPTRIERTAAGWEVTYGGVRPGPFILVWINEKGRADSVWSRLMRN